MLKVVRFIFIFMVMGRSAFGQAPFTNIDSIDVNNINAAIQLQGNMWWNPNAKYSYIAPYEYTFHCYYPPDSQKNISGPGAIWMSAYDGNGQLHVAAATGQADSTDYWPGPLGSADTLTYATSLNWAKVWKVRSSDLATFFGLSTHTTANTPASILTWPGKGNMNAAGVGGTSLKVDENMAPFVDLNEDGIYEPLLGEYPDIKGDEAAWWVFSDNGAAHNLTKGRPLGVEVHAMAYGYNRGTTIDNVVYYEYTIVNRSPNNYTDFRFGQWALPLVGTAVASNFIGFDSVWRMAISYDGTNYDGASAYSYGISPPMSAVTMIQLPGDSGTNYVPAGSFNYYNYDASVIGNPTADTQFSNIMRSKGRLGRHLRDDFEGPGIPSTGYDSGAYPECNYVFDGNLGDSTQWSECAGNNTPGERRYVLASNDFTLNAGASQKVLLALLVSGRHTGGCPVATYDSIRLAADTAWADYINPPAGIETVARQNSIHIYPNPVHSVLYVSANNSPGPESITIYNVLGQQMNALLGQSSTAGVIDVSLLPNAMYFLRYRDGNFQKTVKFVKD